MKLAEAIERVNTEKPNSFKPEILTEYINEVEARVQDFMRGRVRKRYDYKEDGGKELLVPSPYDVLYVSFLKAKIDYANEEYQSYANNQAQFESDWQDFKDWAVREGEAMNTLPVRFKNWW